MNGLNYWKQLQSLKINSLERRREYVVPNLFGQKSNYTKRN